MGEDAMILFPIFQWINSLYISHESPLHYTHQINKIPVYMSDAGYFRNLYKWREYLIANTKGIAGVEKQIDYMYMYMVNLKKNVMVIILIMMNIYFRFKKSYVVKNYYLWRGTCWVYIY